ncbi:methylmalonyl Co-A mutase-associated GTPase MeaB [Stomatohabitans albus]|uniref:methylmalonyl Co-A mutase-associated GTPase MeaB n=1 Tax=Stomatohabitans albus TaxID=3110766 RepID=UPI00300C83D6
MAKAPTAPELAEGVLASSRAHIARAITMVESKKPAHRDIAHELLRLLTPHTGGAVRVGISGVPGAGKSTFINALGMRLVNEHGMKLAVLAVDPSSSQTGGSILGDRTRMGELAMLDNTFIRPSPSGNHLGGVARATREAMVICEAAGYGAVFVETVGVGQSEIAVSEMVDTFLMLHAANTGDSLQGIKRGILELADVIAVNKADGANAAPARIAARELRMALKLVAGSEREPAEVLTCSSTTGEGLDEVWKAITDHRQRLEDTGSLIARRRRQQRQWLWSLVRNEVLTLLENDPEIKAVADRVEHDLDDEGTNAMDAANAILAAFVERAYLLKE